MDPVATWFSLVPPLAAIAVALIWRSVIPALFFGLWLGAWGIAGLDLAGLGRSFLEALTVHVVNAVADEDHASIMLFSFMIGGLVGVINRSGGMQGIVHWMIRRARSRRRGQMATAMLGLAVFVDDYANSLVVGKTMRPVTDRLGISRQKLAYLVDSTAAPVCGLALVSTWIGYQVGLLDEAVSLIDGLDMQGYVLFLNSLAYSFYPWLCLFLVFWVSWSGRDIGPMLQAEARATVSQEDAPEAELEGEAGPVAYAVLPLVLLVIGVLAGLYITGEGDSLREIIGSANAYLALMWSSLIAVLVAMAMPLLQRRASLQELLDGWTEGVHAMLTAMIILVLAWALAATTKELQTAQFLVSLIGDTLPAGLLPALVFLMASLTAFATGTSWGTMGILIPLVVPLAWSLAPAESAILHASVAAVLAGAIWGDHCSPISDTTILSSMATDCDHVEHVRTQLPYAMLVAGVALLVGVLPAGFGFPWWLSMPLGMGLLVLFMRVFGRPS